MSFKGCIGEIQRAMGRALSQQELDDLHEGLKARQKERIRAGDDTEKATLGAADDLARDMERGALVKKRMAAFDAKVRLEAVDYIQSQFPDSPHQGLEAILVGINSAKRGSRDSAAAAQEALKAKYLGGFSADLVQTGHLKLFTRGSLDQEIAQALHDMDLNPENLKTLPKEAVDIARVVAKWQETSRLDANAAGADIGKLAGRISRQSHDIYKIRTVGPAAWKAEVISRADLQKTFGSLDQKQLGEALDELYTQLASGVHLKTNDVSDGFKGPLNLADKVSKSREIHFKTADDWFAYNEKYGVGSLRESVLRDLEMASHNTGLMRKLGPNPGANFDKIAADITKGIKDPAARAKFASDTGSQGYLRNRLSAVDGSARIPGNKMLAQIASGIRVFQSISKLGTALFSHMNDFVNYGSTLRYQGRSMLSGFGEMLGNLSHGKAQAKFAEIDGPLGAFSEAMRENVVSRFSMAEDGVPGAMSKLARLFFKLNGERWWQDVHRMGSIRGMAQHVASVSDRAHAELDPDFQRVLGLYGIDAPKWELIRQAGQKAVDGRSYVTPEGLASIPDEKFGPIVQGDVTPTKLAAAKAALGEQLRTLYIDQAHSAIIGPDARVRAVMTQGSHPGTAWGEILRFVGQFKAFPIAIGYRILGRELYGRGANSLGEALRNGNGEMQGIAQLILWGTVFGYTSLALKNLVKGQAPPDPSRPVTWFQSASHGGGFGLYGDYLLGEFTSSTTPLQKIMSALGPTASTAGDLLDIALKAKDEALNPPKGGTRGHPVALAAIHTAFNSTPFINLFYTKAAMNYLILNRIEENLNPGAGQRRRDAAAKSGQPFLLQPH